MIHEGNVRLFTEKGWILVVRILFGVFILGLLFVGFVRVDHTGQFPLNQYFHTGGAVSAIVIVSIFALLIRKKEFHPWYGYFSIGMVLVTVVMGVLMVFPNGGIVNLTVVELTIFLMVGLWMYVTVSNLLTLANIAAYTNRQRDANDPVNAFVKS